MAAPLFARGISPNPSFSRRRFLGVLGAMAAGAIGCEAPVPTPTRVPAKPTEAPKPTIEPPKPTATVPPTPIVVTGGVAPRPTDLPKPGQQPDARSPFVVVTPTLEAGIPPLTDGELEGVIASIPTLRQRIFLSGYSQTFDTDLRTRKDTWGIEKRPFVNELSGSRKVTGSDIERVSKQYLGDNATRAIAGVREGNTLSFDSATRYVTVPAGEISSHDILTIVGMAADPDSLGDKAPFRMRALAQEGKARMLSALLVGDQGYSFLRKGPGSDEVREGIGKLIIDRGLPFTVKTTPGLRTFEEDLLRRHFKRGNPSIIDLAKVVQRAGKVPDNSADFGSALNNVPRTKELYAAVGEWMLDLMKKSAEQAYQNQRQFSMVGWSPSIEFESDLQKAYNNMMDQALRVVFAEMFASAAESSSVKAIPEIDQGLQELLGALNGRIVTPKPIIPPTSTPINTAPFAPAIPTKPAAKLL